MGHQILTTGRHHARALQGVDDVAATIEWLDALRELSISKALPRLIMRLEYLSRQDIEPKVRLDLMRIYKRPVLKAAASLPNPNPRLPFGGFRSDQGLTAEQRLDQVMGANLKRLFQDLDRKRYTASAATEDNRHWVLSNRFKFLRRQVRYALMARRDCPAHTWQDAHDLFVYLVIRGNVRLNETMEVDVFDDDFDPETEYKRLLLIGHAHLCDLPGDALLTMLPHLPGWAQRSRLTDPGGHLGEFNLLQVEVSKDRPLRVNTSTLDEGFRGWVLLPDKGYLAFVERQRRAVQPFSEYLTA
jgi:hypothetical protein